MARFPPGLVGLELFLSFVGHINYRGVQAMKGRGTILLLVAFLLITFANNVLAQKIKVIVDQDARGPATTDMQSILIFLQSDKFDVLGITTVSGDQWVK